MCRTHPDWEVKKVSIHGTDQSAQWAIAAGAMASGSVDHIEIDRQGFQFAKLNNSWHEDFVPGAVKYGGFDGLLAMNPAGVLREQESSE